MTPVNPLVSIIVPVYNTEAYLEDCLSSIVNQTYQSTEIILINDGSTDRSYEIMESFAVSDNRIIVLSQDNRGVSAARNAGLRVARGEYILFVDSDDTIRDDSVEILCQQAVLTSAAIVLGNVYFCYPDGRKVLLYQRLIQYANQPLLTGVQCFSQFVEDSLFPPLVYLYFTKRSYIIENKLFFSEGIVHEDELWCQQTLIQAPSVSIVDFFHYFYLQRNDSIMHSDDNKKYRIQSYISVVNTLEAFVARLRDKPEFVDAVGYVYVRIFDIYRFICRLLLEIKEDTNEYRVFFESILKRVCPMLSPLQQQACSYFFHNGNSLLFTRSAGLTLSFCITCKNRLHQIRQTLPQNLKDNQDAKDVIEFVLVDLGSTDGLHEWVKGTFADEMAAGYLKYYYTEELPLWHTSIAKNTAHIYANNLIVVNLDCDNFTGKDGGLFVIDNM